MIISESLITVFRSTGGDVFNRGRVVENSRVTIKILGSIQPDSNLKLLRESFGENVVGGIKIYTKENLNIANSSGQSDLIEYNGNTYEVSSEKIYLVNIPHTKYTAIMRKDEN